MQPHLHLQWPRTVTRTTDQPVTVSSRHLGWWVNRPGEFGDFLV